MQETEENQIIFGRTKLTLCKLRALYRYNYYTHTCNYMSIFRLIIYDVENTMDIYESLSKNMYHGVLELINAIIKFLAMVNNRQQICY